MSRPKGSKNKVKRVKKVKPLKKEIKPHGEELKNAPPINQITMDEGQTHFPKDPYTEAVECNAIRTGEKLGEPIEVMKGNKKLIAYRVVMFNIPSQWFYCEKKKWSRHQLNREYKIGWN